MKKTLNIFEKFEKTQRLFIIALIGAFMLLGTTYAAVYITEGDSLFFNDNKTTGLADTTKNLDENQELKNITEESIVTEPIVMSSKFGQMVEELSKQIEDDAEYNIILMNYKYLEKGYKLDSSSLDYICDLILSGYNGKDVINAAYFWLDTSEDISIIEEMCEWKIKNIDYKGNFWEENAFNFVTDNKCGVLLDEDVEAYGEKGIGIDKIMIANRLSRKGEYTIQEILEKYQNGTSMVELAIEIDTRLSEKKKISYTPSVVKDASLLKVDDSEIFVSRELSAISGEPENSYCKSALRSTDLSDELESISEIITEEIKTELKTGGYFRTSGKEEE